MVIDYFEPIDPGRWPTSNAQQVWNRLQKVMESHATLLRELKNIVAHCRDGNESWLVELQRTRIESARMAIIQAEEAIQ